MHYRISTLVLLMGFAPLLRAAEPDPAAFFESKIRPLLADKCFKCHGEKKQKGELRLDSRESILTGGDQGPAIVSGKPGESLLIKAVRQTGELKMPPDKKLSDAQIADLSQWIALGAPWPGAEKSTAVAPVRKPGMQITDKDRAHWSFQPVKRPETPRNASGNPIDAFVSAKRQAKGLKPNPPAEPRELIRRLYYDLTGLPPTPADVEAFAADPSPAAYERVVDSLLASPHYGEKWGRHWLDLVRYAETNSFERDNAKPNVWRYRDYVISSLNADKPYDRFIREQLAGDELPDAGPDGLVATGYYRLGIWDDEPADRDQSRFDGLDDIVATTGQVMLGLTVDCARCHDHKIDPIPQRDYYRLLSFFHNINHYRNGGPTDEAPLFADAAAKDQYDAKLRDLESRRNALQVKLGEIETEFRHKHTGPPSAQHDIEDLNYRFYRDTWDKLPDFASLKPEDTGTLPEGLFDLSPRTRDVSFGFVFEGTLIVPRDGVYKFHLDSDDGSRLTIDGSVLITYDGIHDLGRERSAQVTLTAGRVPIKLEYFQKELGFGLALAWSGPSIPRRTLSAAKSADAAGALPAKQLATLIDREGVRVLGSETAGRYRKLRKELESIKADPPIDKALCVTEASSTPPATFVLLRGNPHVNGDAVEPRFPEVLGGESARIPPSAPEAKTTGRRTVLADWIASPTNPLTARVMVNRVWQYHFGRGIVRTPNDFGFQGAVPSHPELLDWLASEFVGGGWRLKPLHKLIVMSSTYRQSSRGRADALAADPANDFLWRFDMRRLTGEEIRDSILAVTGTLNQSVYGPSVFPEIPKEVLAGQSMPGNGWRTSPPEQQNRRSIYVHQKRSLRLPILESFDAAETDRSTAVRFASTQPTQALGTLNSAWMQKQAGFLAERLNRDAGSDLSAEVRLALQLVTQRPPKDDESARGVALIDRLMKDGESRDDAIKRFCLLALNLNEFVYLD
jgi:mono/diheme cytochrome c family protein